MSFGTSFGGALSGGNWTISLHTIFGEPAQDSAMSMAGIGTDLIPSRSCFRLDNRTISGLQAEFGEACKRPLRLPLRSGIRGFTVRSGETWNEVLRELGWSISFAELCRLARNAPISFRTSALFERNTW